MDRTACTEPQGLYNGALYLYLYLYSPMGRKACTEPQCLYNGTFYLYVYLYRPMCRTACTEPQCLYNCRAHWGMGLIFHQAKPRWTRREEDSKSSVLDLCLGMRS